MLWVLTTEFKNYKLWIKQSESTSKIGTPPTLGILDFPPIFETKTETELDVFISKSLVDFKNYFFDKNPNYHSLQKEPSAILGNEILMQYKSAFNRHGIGIKNNLFRHLLFKNNNIWVDIENEYYDILIKLFKNKLSPLEFKSIEALNSDFEQIRELLKTYLNENIDTNVSIEALQDVFLNIAKPYLNENENFLQKLIIKPICILNFNYTATPEMYNSFLKDHHISELNYIHGDLRDTKKNPLIFGFGDEKEEHYLPMESCKDDRFLEFIKSFAYLKTPYYSKLLSFIEDDKYEVIIMGHSCGQSDRVLLKTIFEHENCEKIIIKYYER